MTSSTVSSELSLRSSMNYASGTTSSGRTPRLSQMISFTRSSTGLVINTSSSHAGVRLRPARFLRSHCRPSSHVQSAVDVDDLAGDVPTALTGQEPHDLGHVLHRPDPLQRDLLHQGLASVGGNRRRHVR